MTSTGGSIKRSALAVLIFITSSGVMTGCTGRSAVSRRRGFWHVQSHLAIAVSEIGIGAHQPSVGSGLMLARTRLALQAEGLGPGGIPRIILPEIGPK
jgi:hypothetical protein